jgi:hypothetical protein
MRVAVGIQAVGPDNGGPIVAINVTTDTNVYVTTFWRIDWTLNVREINRALVQTGLSALYQQFGIKPSQITDVKLYGGAINWR